MMLSLRDHFRRVLAILAVDVVFWSIFFRGCHLLSRLQPRLEATLLIRAAVAICARLKIWKFTTSLGRKLGSLCQVD